MPVSDACRAEDHVAGFQPAGLMALLLFPPLPGGDDQQLAVRVGVPTVDASGCEGHIAGGAFCVWISQSVQPDMTGEVGSISRVSQGIGP